MANISDLGRIEMADMALPDQLIWTDADLSSVVTGAKGPITLHGRRHSQGGQSLCDQALALDLDLIQDIAIRQEQGQWLASVPAGVSWDALHHALAAHTERLAPVTHQSSPYFSIGGSLAVNCHGRDPAQGPVGNSVRALTVMLPNGQTRTLQRGVPGDHALMRTVLGGFGACAIMLRAELDLKPEVCVQHHTEQCSDVEYQEWLLKRKQSNDWPALHHAWLRCTNDQQMFKEALCATSTVVEPCTHFSDRLQNETILSDDALSMVYDLYRQTPTAVDAVLWKALAALATQAQGKTERLLNAMRAPVRFTMSPPDGTTDLLQEFFVPFGQLSDFLQRASGVWRAHMKNHPNQLKLLTSTARVVQADTATELAYAPGEARVAVVFNYNLDLNLAHATPGGVSPHDELVRGLIDAAHAVGGRYYLAYSRSATPEQFSSIYGQGSSAAFRKTRQATDPTRKFDNQFLRTYIN